MEYKLKTDDVKRRYREYEISGDVSIQNIEALLAEMRDCVNDCDELSIKLVQITGFDTAALQFFCSLRNSFARDKKKLSVVSSLSDDVRLLLHNCGVDNLDKVLSTED